MPTLSKVDIKARLKDMDGWALDDGELVKKFKLNDFAASMAFVNSVAERAEAADHHPDISIKYNKVKLKLATHSEGGITEKDFALAAEIDAVAPTRSADDLAAAEDV